MQLLTYYKQQHAWQ